MQEPEMTTVLKPFARLTVDELHDIYRLRAAVFVVEQQCAYQDIDGLDKAAWHLYFRDGQGLAAYARLLPPGVMFPQAAIGRVITARRGCGLGRRLMLTAIDETRRLFGADEIQIMAQSYAQGFYEKCGFHRISEPYLEDGIPHVNMRWTAPGLPPEGDAP